MINTFQNLGQCVFLAEFMLFLVVYAHSVNESVSERARALSDHTQCYHIQNTNVSISQRASELARAHTREPRVTSTNVKRIRPTLTHCLKTQSVDKVSARERGYEDLFFFRSFIRSFYRSATKKLKHTATATAAHTKFYASSFHLFARSNVIERSHTENIFVFVQFETILHQKRLTDNFVHLTFSAANNHAKACQSENERERESAVANTRSM